MTSSIKLLKQIRSATQRIHATADNPEHKSALAVVDVLLNELMLQEDRGFYLRLLQQGESLLREGEALAKCAGLQIAEQLTWDSFDETQRIEAFDVQIDQLFDALAAIVGVLEEEHDPQKSWHSRVTQWESSLYRRSLESIPMQWETIGPDITQHRLEQYLAEKFPALGGVKVTKLIVLAGGLSKKTILFETDKPIYGTQSMVIRAEQPINLLYFDGSDVAREYYMVQLMQKHGMPIAEPLWLEEDASRLGMRFIVSRKAEGGPIGDNFGSYQPLTPGQVESYLSNYFKLHSIQPDATDPLVQRSHLGLWLPYKTIRDVTRFFAAEYLPTLIRRAGIKTTPEMLRALRWLERNAPDSDEPPVIIHVDYAFNNMIFDGDCMSALLDWETSRLADPADDFIWTQPNLGLYGMDEFRLKYKQGTGRDVSAYRVAYAAVSKCLINLIAGRTALKYINESEVAPLHMAMMAYKFMPIIGSNVDELISDAEGKKR